jgi:hypothetical protein
LKVELCMAALIIRRSPFFSDLGDSTGDALVVLVASSTNDFRKDRLLVRGETLPLFLEDGGDLEPGLCSGFNFDEDFLDFFSVESSDLEDLRDVSSNDDEDFLSRSLLLELSSNDEEDFLGRSLLLELSSNDDDDLGRSLLLDDLRFSALASMTALVFTSSILIMS